MSEYGVRLELKDRVGIITFDRPEKGNTFDETMWSGLEHVVSELQKNLPRVLLLTGSGDKSFCGGFDVNPGNPQVANLIEAVQNHDRSPVEKLLRRIRDVVDSLISLPVPIIAAINGSAYGGGAELAVRCDMRVTDPDAVICFSEVRLGLMPDWGGGVALTRLVGPANAADMILTAREIRAEEALRLGLVNRMSLPGKSLDESLILAEAIAGNGPCAVRSALEVIRRTSDMPLDDALDLEMERAVSLITSGECYHGITAFLSKKEPEFPDC
ncbi:enoyl-CoA hydratase/isomerase family protein [Desulfococcaceae bacterium HSG8]|nr:enoyl-CoA hydratase/isomerase family protein [Desulfococcaceae bacterium HSG8]